MNSIKYHDTKTCIIPLVCISSLSASCFIHEIRFNYNNKTKQILTDSSNFLYYFGCGLSSYYLFNYVKYSLKY